MTLAIAVASAAIIYSVIFYLYGQLHQPMVQPRIGTFLIFVAVGIEILAGGMARLDKNIICCFGVEKVLS